jgi:hypothetical protein
MREAFTELHPDLGNPEKALCAGIVKESWSTQHWRNDKSARIFDVLDLSSRPIPRLAPTVSNIVRKVATVTILQDQNSAC